LSWCASADLATTLADTLCVYVSLFAAVQEVVEMLLAAGAKPNIKDNLGGCALMEAVKAGQDDIIRLLMAKGATLNLLPAEQATLMCGAVSAGDIPRLKRLIRCKADVAASDYDDHTPLHVAAAGGHLMAVSQSYWGASARLWWRAGGVAHQ
jgi:ankyrin repeat protein